MAVLIASARCQCTTDCLLCCNVLLGACCIAALPGLTCAVAMQLFIDGSIHFMQGNMDGLSVNVGSDSASQQAHKVWVEDSADWLPVVGVRGLKSATSVSKMHYMTITFPGEGILINARMKSACSARNARDQQDVKSVPAWPEQALAAGLLSDADYQALKDRRYKV